MGSPCVPAFPVSSANSASRWTFHPLPIDLGEVRKLCKIEQAGVRSHLEPIRKSRRKSRHDRASANTDVISRAALRVPFSAGVTSEVVTPHAVDSLRHPDWEVLRPSVVIRRRPQRMQLLGLT